MEQDYMTMMQRQFNSMGIINQNDSFQQSNLSFGKGDRERNSIERLEDEMSQFRARQKAQMQTSYAHNENLSVNRSFA